MTGQDGGTGTPRGRRLRVVPGQPGLTHDDGLDTAAPSLLAVPADGGPAPRVDALDSLLRDVDALRATLRRDLTLAATALEGGEPGLAGYLINADRDALGAFRATAGHRLEGLSDLPATGAGRRRRVRQLISAAPITAAAAAVIAFATGVVPTGLPSGGTSSSAARNDAYASYARVSQLTEAGAPVTQVTAAAQRLQDALAPLVDRARTDPGAAETAIALLQAEQVLLTDSSDHTQLRGVLRAAQLLVRRLRAQLPVPLPSSAAQPVPAGSSSPAPHPSRGPSASPAPTPSAAPSSRPSPAPRPSASAGPRHSAGPSPSPSDPNPLATPVAP